MNKPTGIIPGYMRERVEDYRRKQAQAKKKTRASMERPSEQPVASKKSQRRVSGRGSRGKK
jgi:hypothetical protein